MTRKRVSWLTVSTSGELFMMVLTRAWGKQLLSLPLALPGGEAAATDAPFDDTLASDTKGVTGAEFDIFLFNSPQ